MHLWTCCIACLLYYSMPWFCSFFLQPRGWAAPFPRSFSVVAGVLSCWLPAVELGCRHCLLSPPVPCPVMSCWAHKLHFALFCCVSLLQAVLLPLKALVVVWWHTQFVGIFQIQADRPWMTFKHLSRKAKSRSSHVKKYSCLSLGRRQKDIF